jgi:hypothetical protein
VDKGLDVTEDERFLERLGRGPAGLLLGQRHLALGSSTDPLLAVIRRKLDGAADEAHTYDVLLSAADDSAGFLDWLDTKTRTLAVSEQLETIARYVWIGAWSSAIDTLWADAFENWWREVQKVFSESYRPPDPRNRIRLHCTFLFGTTNRSDPDERPPLSKLEYLRRRTIAQSLARRIPDAVGPTGTLAIEGYGLGDWFSVEDLAGIVAQMQPGQSHLFTTSDELLATPEISELVTQGLLVVHAGSLANALTEGDRAGIIKLGVLAEEGDLQRVVSFGGRTRSVPRDLWIPLSSSAHLLDESILGDPRPLSADARYAAFRSFLGAAAGRPDWEGTARGFAFARDFEEDLERRVVDFAAHRNLPEHPIVIHGATGTGKTTAMASLAHRLARRRQYPILFVDRRAPQSAQKAVDRLCQWAEDEGAPVSVVLWDGMLELDEYEDLARLFAGRGRRVVLVGSTYRIPERRAQRRSNLVSAPSELSSGEVRRLEAFLAEFDEQLATLTRLGAGFDSSFLVFLYRLLPPTRAAVRSGVVRELERVERMVVERSMASDAEYELRTTLGWALLDAGLLPDLQFDRTPDIEVAGERFSAIEDLAALVMVCGQFGLAVPLELVLRATGQVGYANVPKLLEDIDLVRWVEDRAGNFLLAARTRLEAQLIIRSRLGTTTGEVEYARRLLLEVRGSDTALSGTAEVDFAIEFVRALGAHGPSPERYLAEYPTIATALRELREERGLANPRLMLQEANLLREWSIKQQQQQPEQDREATLRALVEAANILSAALDLLPPEGRTPLRSRLEVELASTLAAHAQTLRSMPEAAEERVRLFAEARDVALRARAEDPESYYPVDVLAWATRDAIRDGLLNDRELAEAIAEALSAFDIIDPFELDPGQAERYHERRQQFAEQIGDVNLADEAFAALAAQNSGAGVYLRAKAIADPSSFKGSLSPHDVQQVQKALEYLMSYSDLVAQDIRCLNLRLDLWWMLHAGQRPFADVRHCLAFDVAEWRELLTIIDDLERHGRTYRDVPLQFLRGLAEFHLSDFTAAFATFREVERRSDEVRGRRRIVRSYLASTPEGRPVVFHGTVSWLSNDLRRGEVYVDELRRRVTFIPREFASRELARDVNLGEFHIAFNFLGVIADPPGYLQARRYRASPNGVTTTP